MVKRKVESMAADACGVDRLGRNQFKHFELKSSVLSLSIAISLFLLPPRVLSAPISRTSRVATAVSERIVRSRIVSLPLGDIQGAPCDRFPEITQFLGVPYAEPALGARRFQPSIKYNQSYPTPAFDATVRAPPCGSICGHQGSTDTTFSTEDCLILNVWVPPTAIANTTKLPVRAYLHGGAVTECSASDPNIGACEFVSRTDIIQVNIQFRAGIFGFLAHRETFNESNTTGNWGLLDQQLALTWIKEHIAYFGGDPLKVLLNGNSAGGQKVDFHMVLPGSRGLFSAAISQSPPCSHFISLQQAYDVSDEFVFSTGCSNPSNRSTELGCLRGLPWQYLMGLSRTLGQERTREIVMCDQADWRPSFHHTVDGTVVPRQITDAYISGKYNQVPYLVGVMTADGREFVEDLYVNEGLPINTGTLYALIEEVYPLADPEPVLAMYPEEPYANLVQPAKARLTDIWTDIFFACPVFNRLNLMQRTSAAPLFLYQMGAIPSCPPGDFVFGPTHASELLYTSGITTHIYPPNGTCDFPEPEVMMTQIVNHAWASMAVNKYPSWTDGVPWPIWNSTAQMGVYIDHHPRCALREISFQKRCKVLGLAKEQSILRLAEHPTSNPDL